MSSENDAFEKLQDVYKELSALDRRIKNIDSHIEAWETNGLRDEDLMWSALSSEAQRAIIEIAVSDLRMQKAADQQRINSFSFEHSFSPEDWILKRK